MTNMMVVVVFVERTTVPECHTVFPTVTLSRVVAFTIYYDGLGL